MSFFGKEGDLPILGVTATALLMLCVLPPGDLIDEVCQLVPELINQRPLIHVDRDSVSLGAAIFHGDHVGHGVGEIHCLAAARRQGLDTVGGDSGSQFCHIRAAGHGDGDGVSGVVHRANHAIDGEAGDTFSGRCSSLPLIGDRHIARRHGKEVVCDGFGFTTRCCQRELLLQFPSLYTLDRVKGSCKFFSCWSLLPSFKSVGRFTFITSLPASVNHSRQYWNGD